MNNKEKYTGKDLLSMGCESGPTVGKVLDIVNATPHTRAEVETVIKDHAPPPTIDLLHSPAPCEYNITPTNELEEANVAAVKETMDAV